MENNSSIFNNEIFKIIVRYSLNNQNSLKILENILKNTNTSIKKILIHSPNDVFEIYTHYDGVKIIWSETQSKLKLT